LKLAPTKPDTMPWFCQRSKKPEPLLLPELVLVVCPPVVVVPVVEVPVVEVPVVPVVEVPVVVVVVPVWPLVDVCADNAVGTLTANAVTTAS